MAAGSLLRRFLIPAPIVTLACWVKFRARVSPRAEVELSPHLHLGRGVNISSFCKVKASDRVHIGADTHIATGCFLGAGAAGLEIGADCLIGPNCVIIASEYVYTRLDVPLRLQGHTSRGITIGRNVFIGGNSVILDGARIENDVIIAAGSVVSGHVQAASVLSGNPAKLIFRRR